MHHTGTLYMSKARPQAARENGVFTLTLRLLDNLGRGWEAYVVTWTGDEALAFWQAHQHALVAGAILSVELERLRAHVGHTRPPLPELHARVVRMQLCPKRLPHEREQLSNQEHHATA